MACAGDEIELTLPKVAHDCGDTVMGNDYFCRIVRPPYAVEFNTLK
jgi:hypothetical protein